MIQKINYTNPYSNYHFKKLANINFKGLENEETKQAEKSAQTMYEYSMNVARHGEKLYNEVTSMLEAGEEINFKNIYKDGKLKIKYETGPSFNSKLVPVKVTKYDNYGNAVLEAQILNFHPVYVKESFANSSSSNLYEYRALNPYEYRYKGKSHPKRAYIGLKRDEDHTTSCSKRFSWTYNDGWEIDKIEKGYKRHEDNTISCDEFYKWSFGELDSFYKDYTNSQGRINASQTVYFNY